MEGRTDLNVAQPEAGSGVGGEGEAAAASGGVGLDMKGDSCDGSAVGQSKGLAVPPAPSVESPNADSAAGVPVKVATTVLHPVIQLPFHVQMAGAAGPQLGQMGAAPYVIASQNPLTLPLVLDQQVVQHMNPSVIPPSNNCQQAHIMNPLAFSLPPSVDQKTDGPAPDVNLLSLLQNPAFAGLLQDLFTSQTGQTAFQSPGSPLYPAPPLTPPYASPLAPLVPPATLLVPYPVIIPLPVPLPIPLPIPVPVPQTEDSKGNLPKPVCTVNTSTQTCPHDTTSPSGSSNKCPPFFQPHSPSTLPLVEGQALDLSLRTFPVQPKTENPSPQPDNALDLSVPCVRKTFPQQDRGLGSSDSKLLASLEFSQQHKWMVDSIPCGSSSGGQQASHSRAGNLEICGSSQAAKVIVSVKEAIPAILCGKIKSLSGVSSKSISIKRDGQSSSLQQLYSVPAVSKAERHNPADPLNKVPKNRAIKLKKVSSQEIHFLPIKKQRLAALLPRK